MGLPFSPENGFSIVGPILCSLLLSCALIWWRLGGMQAEMT